MSKVIVMRKEDQEIFIVNEVTGDIYCVKKYWDGSQSECNLILYDNGYITIKLDLEK